MNECKLRFIGTQQGVGRIPSVDLFNVMYLENAIADCPLVIGSTVTLASVERAGFVAIIEPGEQKTT
jgi:hypothetical protein